MKVAIIGTSTKLKNLFDRLLQFNEYVSVENFDELKKEKKIRYVFSERGDLVAADLNQIRLNFPDVKILILSKTEDQFFEKTCLVHDILYLNESMGEMKCVELIQKKWFNQVQKNEYHNVIAIHGTHRSTGVTQTALSLGHVIGGLGLKTLVIGLNPFSPGEYPSVTGTYSFETIYELVENQVINDGETLLPYLSDLDYFKYLIGNRDFYKALTFQPEPIQRLIDIAKEYFNIVILDVGAFYDSFMAKVALESSNTHVLISTQEHQATEEYIRWKNQILSLFDCTPKSHYQVVNKYASKAIIQSKQLESTLQIPVLTEIPHFPESADAIMTEGILYFADYKPYYRAIDGLARALVGEVIPDEPKPVKKGLLSRLVGSVV